jgi:hypothetical protein
MSLLDGGMKEELQDAFDLKIETRQLIRRLGGVPGQPGIIEVTEALVKSFDGSQEVWREIAASMKEPGEIRRELAAVHKEIEGMPWRLSHVVDSPEFGELVRNRLQAEVDEVVQAGRDSAVEVITEDLTDRMAASLKVAVLDVFGAATNNQKLLSEIKDKENTIATLQFEVARLHKLVSDVAANPKIEAMTGKMWGFGTGVVIGAFIAGTIAFPLLLQAVKSFLLD